jgi:hypothetical protein
MEDRKKKMKELGLCTQPDRDVPGMLCGYPLPCPYHTIVFENVETAVEFLEKIDAAGGLENTVDIPCENTADKGTLSEVKGRE